MTIHRAARAWGLAWAILATALVARLAHGAEEVPFVTTPDHVTRAMLELARLEPGDHVIDLGSGDGRIVIMAARMGATGAGVEIVPDLVEKSRTYARRAGVADKVDFRVQDLFDTPLDRATVVTMYLLPEINLKLRPRLLALPAGTRVVSHDWDMGDWAPDRSVTLDVPDKVVGREKVSRVHLWVVPARVQGTWCAKGLRLEITQRFQRYTAVLERLDPKSSQPLLVQDGVIDAADGVTLRPAAHAPDGTTWRVEGEGLRVISAGPDIERGMRFARRLSAASPCPE